MGRLLLATLSPTRPHLPLLLESSAQPLVRALPRAYTPEYCFERLAALGGCVWLDSNLQSPELQLSALGRYSYLAADPFSKIRVDEPVGAVLDQVAGLLHQFYQPRIPDLPPMQGGWMGWLGYELGRTFERLPTALQRISITCRRLRAIRCRPQLGSPARAGLDRLAGLADDRVDGASRGMRIDDCSIFCGYSSCLRSWRVRRHRLGTIASTGCVHRSWLRSIPRVGRQSGPAIFPPLVFAKLSHVASSTSTLGTSSKSI
ncbi:MAG: hypothetical protein R3C56_15805 [Pirellulaceae bacterium]